MGLHKAGFQRDMEHNTEQPNQSHSREEEPQHRKHSTPRTNPTNHSVRSKNRTPVHEFSNPWCLSEPINQKKKKKSIKLEESQQRNDL